MRVQEIATRAGVSAHTVRYYNKLGLLSSGRDPFNQYRRFDVGAVERLQFVRRAKALGFSLAEIGEILSMSHSGRSPCPQVRDIVNKRITEVAARIADLQQLHRRLENASRQWTGMRDRAPSGREICHLIESLVGDAA